MTTSGVLRLRGRRWPPGSFAVMAVVNRTPDSFYDRGATFGFAAALAAAQRAIDDGAEIIDIGGVKAGPGDEVSVTEEVDRVAGLVAAVRARDQHVVISVDTWRAEVGEAVAELELEHVVITSVNRDELADGGAAIFAATIREIRRARPECSVEVLIPDFQANWDALQLVMDAQPEILNHNIETVARLSDRVRSKAKYPRSLELLRRAKLMNPAAFTKSGIMLGLGEEHDEVLQALRDLRDAGVDIVTIGQYLRPSMHHLPLQRYYTPDEFAELKAAALEMGFAHCESGPLVRSSYHAHAQIPAGRKPSMPVVTAV